MHERQIPKLTAHVDVKKLYLMVIAAVIGYAVLYLFFFDRVQKILFGICVAIAVVYGLKEILLNNTRIEINELGILDSRLGLGTVRWRDITRVYVTELNNVDHVCMDVVDPDRYLKKRSAVTRGLLKFHQKTNNISPFNINTGALDVGTHEIFEAIATGLEVYGINSRRSEGVGSGIQSPKDLKVFSPRNRRRSTSRPSWRTC